MRECPPIAGYRLLRVPWPGQWIVVRGAMVTRKGSPRWAPRSGLNGGALRSYRPGRIVARYVRVAGDTVGAARGLSTTRALPVRQKRSVPPEAVDIGIPHSAAQFEPELVG